MMRSLILTLNGTEADITRLWELLRPAILDDAEELREVGKLVHQNLKRGKTD